MKPLLYLLLTVGSVIALWSCEDENKEVPLTLYKGWMVVSRSKITNHEGKNDVGYEVKLQKGDSIISVRTVYYYAYKYQSGDTIK